MCIIQNSALVYIRILYVLYMDDIDNVRTAENDAITNARAVRKQFRKPIVLACFINFF